jgi:uncharacterized membrane protein
MSLFLIWLIASFCIFIIGIVVVLGTEDVSIGISVFFTLEAFCTVTILIIGMFEQHIDKEAPKPKQEIIVDSARTIDSLSAYQIELPEIILIK